MKLGFCVACGSEDDLHHHHLVPHSAGGNDDAMNLITLCAGCHLKLNERRSGGGYNHRRLTQAGLAAAKARGVRIGNPKGTTVLRSAIGRERGRAASVANPQAFAERQRPVLAELARLSANSAAAELDRRGFATARGGKWTARSVINVRQRLEG